MIAIFLVLAVVVYLWVNNGYGKVSPKTYELSKALYGACLAKSDERIEKVDLILSAESARGGVEITRQEKAWLNRIIRKARNGKWEAAAKSSRRMMEDQVEY